MCISVTTPIPASARWTNSNGLTVLVGEFERSFGIGSVAVAIPTDMFVVMSDRIILSITEAEVSQRLAGTDRRR